MSMACWMCRHQKKYVYQLTNENKVNFAVIIASSEAEARMRACEYNPGGSWMSAEAIQIARVFRTSLCQVLALEKL